MPRLWVAVRFVNKLMPTGKAVRQRTPSLPKGVGVLCLHTNHLLGLFSVGSRNLLCGLTSRGCLLSGVPLPDAQTQHFKWALTAWSVFIKAHFGKNLHLGKGHFWNHFYDSFFWSPSSTPIFTSRLNNLKDLSLLREIEQIQRKSCAQSCAKAVEEGL